METFPTFWVTALALATLWTTAFSLSSRPGVRGWRNLGWLACYPLGLAMLVLLPWRVSLTVWAAFGIAGGAFYLAYEVFSYVRQRGSGEAAAPRPFTVLHGLAMWPIMVPEAAEYWLADLGVLPGPPAETIAADAAAPPQ
jgi:hypothetical protein